MCHPCTPHAGQPQAPPRHPHPSDQRFKLGRSRSLDSLREGTVRELCRLNASKGAWTRLLPRSLAWLRERSLLSPEEELPDTSESYKANPVFTHLARSCPFRLEFSRPCRKARHINEGELLAAIIGEARRTYRSPFCKILTLCDSQVACGCLAKGRSGSQSLRRILLRSLGLSLAFGMVLLVSYIASADNPSDDPTRGKDVRKPTERPAAWLLAAERGNFAVLDSTLADLGFAPLDIAGLPPGSSKIFTCRS